MRIFWDKDSNDLFKSLIFSSGSLKLGAVWCVGYHSKSLSNDEFFLNGSKLKVFADDKMNISKEKESVFGMGRKHCGEKVEMLVTSIFSFSHKVFQRLLFHGH